MSEARWSMLFAFMLAASCSCMDRGDEAGDDGDAWDGGEESGRDEWETIDGRETAERDRQEHREFDYENGETDASLPEAIVMPPVCGDDNVDPGEECDDGNRLNGDGCDWMCRRGSDPFEYPPPDPDARPVEPSGPPREVTGETEISAFVANGFRGHPCHPLWLTAGGGRFALVYGYDQPYYGVRLRILDRAGRTVGEAWSHETRWSMFEQALMPIDDGFGLISGSMAYGLMRSRFDLDGIPREEFMTLRPSREILDPWDSLVSGAYSQGHWLAVSFLCCGDCPVLLLESFTDDGTPASRSAIDTADIGGCMSAISTGTGFAIGDGTQVVVLDLELSVVSWSGIMSGTAEGATEGAIGLARDGYWISWSTGNGDGYPGTKSIWVAAMDLDGSPRFPPRRILERVPKPIGAAGTGPYTDVPELAVAVGPAGAAVVYWQGLGEGEAEGGPVMLVTVDDWGNVITPPTPVLGEGEITTLGWILAAAADDLGYGVVTLGNGTVPGAALLVFRHYAAVP